MLPMTPNKWPNRLDWICFAQMIIFFGTLILLDSY